MARYMTSTFGSTLFLEELFAHRQEMRLKAVHDGVALCLAAGAGTTRRTAFARASIAMQIFSYSLHVGAWMHPDRQGGPRGLPTGAGQ